MISCFKMIRIVITTFSPFNYFRFLLLKTLDYFSNDYLC